jgi:hypothetical protein
LQNSTSRGIDTSIDLAHVPLNGLVSLVMEDSLSYLCSGNDSLSLQTFTMLDNYVPILNRPDFYLFRYEITEEVYEYAGAHHIYQMRNEEWVSGFRFHTGSLLRPILVR